MKIPTFGDVLSLLLLEFFFWRICCYFLNFSFEFFLILKIFIWRFCCFHSAFFVVSFWLLFWILSYSEDFYLKILLFPIHSYSFLYFVSFHITFLLFYLCTFITFLLFHFCTFIGLILPLFVIINVIWWKPLWSKY